MIVGEGGRFADMRDALMDYLVDDRAGEDAAHDTVLEEEVTSNTMILGAGLFAIAHAVETLSDVLSLRLSEVQKAIDRVPGSDG